MKVLRKLFAKSEKEEGKKNNRVEESEYQKKRRRSTVNTATIGTGVAGLTTGSMLGQIHDLGKALKFDRRSREYNEGFNEFASRLNNGKVLFEEVSARNRYGNALNDYARNMIDKKNLNKRRLAYAMAGAGVGLGLGVLNSGRLNKSIKEKNEKNNAKRRELRRKTFSAVGMDRESSAFYEELLKKGRKEGWKPAKMKILEERRDYYLEHEAAARNATAEQKAAGAAAESRRRASQRTTSYNTSGKGWEFKGTKADEAFSKKNAERFVKDAEKFEKKAANYGKNSSRLFKGAAIGLGIGVGAAIGAHYYRKHQDNKKRNYDTTTK